MLKTNMMDVTSFINDEIFDGFDLQGFNYNRLKGTLELTFTFKDVEVPQSILTFMFVFDKQTHDIINITVDVKGTVEDLLKYPFVGRDSTEDKKELSKIIRYYFDVQRIMYQSAKLRVVRQGLLKAQ